MERTDVEKKLRLPAPMTFGGRTFPVRPLPWRRNLEWNRKNVALGKKAAVLQAGLEKKVTSDAEAAMADVEYLATNHQEEICELVMEWLKYSLEEEDLAFVDANATLDEMVAAYRDLDDWANPLKPPTQAASTGDAKAVSPVADSSSAATSE